MDSLKQTKFEGVFYSLADVKPRNIEEYCEIMCRVLGDMADAFEIERVVCNITQPKDAPKGLDDSQSMTLLEGNPDNAGEPVMFRWPFALTGNIEFQVYPVKGENTVRECENELSMVFHLLYHILNAILFDNLYIKLTKCDMFTGIPNLSAFFQFCGMLFAQGKIKQYTAFNFNIRNFKSIHNSLTYLDGSRIMRIYCNIVSNAITENEIIARLGGDNFVALILNDNKDYFLDLIGNMVVKYNKDGRLYTFLLGATVGALRISEEKNTSEVMMHISTAYHAARDKRYTLCYYDRNAEKGLLEQKTILSKFFQAVTAGEFKVMYQPKVSVRDKVLCGAEALVRWIPPDGNMIMPGKFIPVLEKDGCICTLDFYMLREVCKFQKKMIEKGIEPVKISVNFSKRHLSNNKLVEEIVEIVDLYNIPHDKIEIELTESENFVNNSVMKDVVDGLGVLGIKTSIDDFGTGYSSLGMLRTLPLDTLKIDRCFIPNTENKDKENGDMEKSMLMLKGVVNLAKSLGLTTVAEGVETPDQFEILKDLDCDIIQGFIFDKPLPEEEFIERLEKRVYVINRTS